MDLATFMQYLTGAQSAGANTMPAMGAAPSPVEVLGQDLDAAKVAVPRRPYAGPGRYTRGGRYGAVPVARADALQSQWESAIGNPGAVQNDSRMVPELGRWGAVP